jgi:hypothetical protein
MGTSYIRDSRFQASCTETRFYVEGVSKADLIKLGLCNICAQMLKTRNVVCSGITNGSPYMTLPANIVDKYTLKEIDDIRKCNVI